MTIKKNIFFIGINGIGMSALALYAKKRNFFVCGVDKNLNKDIQKILANANINVLLEKETDPSIVLDYDMIIITNSIQKTHLFYQCAIKNNIKILKRSEFLSILLQNKKIIAISGSHGKTTTSAIISDMLIKAKPNKPTVFVGGILKEYHTNFLDYKKSTCIVEADDAYKSFLDLNPTISIITSISCEHLETYKDIDDIITNFVIFALKTNSNGYIIINTDSLYIRQFITIIQKYSYKKIITYGFHELSDYKIIMCHKPNQFILLKNNHCIGKYQSFLPGTANIQNTTAAIILSHILNIPYSKIKTNLKQFLGVKRRFEYIGKYKNLIEIYDDYGHHPNEIAMTFNIIVKKNKKAIIYFQPHKYSRTKALWNEFIDIFIQHSSIIEKLYITDIYGIEEIYDHQFNSQNLLKSIQPLFNAVEYLQIDSSFSYFKYKIEKDFNIIKNNNNIILTLGAGIMNQWAEILTTL